MKLAVLALLFLGTFGANPEKKAPSGEGKKGSWNMDKDTADKFKDLGKETRNVTARWKRYPHRQNRTNETSSALRGQFRRFADKKNVSFCGRKVPMKFRYLWLEKEPTESDLLGSPQKRIYNTWAATRGGRSRMMTSALQKHPGEDSYALPGSGGEQKLAEGGAIGTVAGEEPFATVLKDGFWEVGCYTDKMVMTGDKFGDEKDKYKGEGGGVSIANYEDLIDDADKKPMTPTICYEFCSTLPDMVFFGITGGRTCYCTPYFYPGPSDGSKCDATCEGDGYSMCGSTSGRSSVFEMHLCGDL